VHGLLRLQAAGHGVLRLVKRDAPRVALLVKHVARIVVDRLAQHRVVHRQRLGGQALACLHQGCKWAEQ
jgi:hypothetical protein